MVGGVETPVQKHHLANEEIMIICECGRPIINTERTTDELLRLQEIERRFDAMVDHLTSRNNIFNADPVLLGLASGISPEFYKGN